MEINITLEGIRPILMHNSRLANPVDPWTLKIKEVTSKRKKTETDHQTVSHLEARGSCYETADGLLAIPVDNVFGSIYVAAKAFKLGTRIKGALIPITDIEPIYLDGETRSADEHLSTWDNVDIRSVAVQRARVMRSRPIIRAPWTVTHTFEYMDDEINPAELQQILDRAGKIVGIGDYRPRFGTFTATFGAA